MEIIDMIENELYNYIKERYYEPKMIIINPETWGKLIRDTYHGQYLNIAYNDGVPRYKGYRVLRSHDLKLNEIKIG